MARLPPPPPSHPRDVEALVLTGAGTQDPEAAELATEFGRKFSVAVIMS